jgi:C1A family cysteine protease
MPTKQYTKWLQDPIDERDLIQEIVHPTNGVRDLVDLSPYFTAIEDQGNLNSCTGNAIVSLLEYYYSIKSNPLDFSRLFIYYNERIMEGTESLDNGAFIRDGIKSLAKYGVCTEKLHPYSYSNVKVRPSEPAYNEALKYKISKYKRLLTLDDMLHSLNNNNPFVFGMSVYSSFEGNAIARNGQLDMPSVGETEIGGHAVAAVGYNIKKRLIKVRNSWGSNWGDKGYFYMPFDFIGNPDLANDFWNVIL